MKFKFFFLIVLFLTSLTAHSQSVDMFLVIGQSNMRGRGPVTQPATIFPTDYTAYDYNGIGFSLLGKTSSLGIGQTGAPLSSCGSSCYWTSNYYGLLMSFAKTWKDKTGRNAAFVVRPKGGTSLTMSADTGQGYWLDFTNQSTCGDPSCRGIYQNALNTFNQAYITALDFWGVNKTYVLWVQGENDLNAGVSSSDYLNGLQTLFNKLDADRLSIARPAFDGFFIAETGYFHNSTAYNTIPDSLATHRQKVQNITTAQNTAGEIGKIVFTSKSAGVFMSPCINSTPGQTTNLPADCGSFDLIHYKTEMYEKLGVEMATYGALYSLDNIKPLSSGCTSPTGCAPTVNVYRWSSFGGGETDHATSILPNEFDSNSPYAFKGVRYHLFSSAGTGRIPLYRKFNSITKDYMESTAMKGDWNYGNAITLGYCNSASTPPLLTVPIKRLMLLNSSGVIINRVTSKDPTEINLFINQGYIDEGVLCYVN